MLDKFCIGFLYTRTAINLKFGVAGIILSDSLQFDDAGFALRADLYKKANVIEIGSNERLLEVEYFYWFKRLDVK